MKAILISVHANWCALMMNGDKTVEVRKGTALYKAIQKLIDEYGYAEFYVCCTKGKPNLWLPYEYDCFELDEASQPYLSDKPIVDIDTKMNGKVIFKFRCYKVEEIAQRWVTLLETKSLECYELLHLSCLKYEELFDYLRGRKEPKGTAIRISDLEIFDKPKELSEFYKVGHYEDLDDYFTDEKQINGKWCIPLKKSPQSFCYIEVEDVL